MNGEILKYLNGNIGNEWERSLSVEAFTVKVLSLMMTMQNDAQGNTIITCVFVCVWECFIFVR